MTTETYKPGDLVQLTSGSLKMNVHKVENGLCEVVWMDREGKMHAADVDPCVLQRYVPRPPRVDHGRDRGHGRGPRHHEDGGGYDGDVIDQGHGRGRRDRWRN